MIRVSFLYTPQGLLPQEDMNFVAGMGDMAMV